VRIAAPGRGGRLLEPRPAVEPAIRAGSRRSGRRYRSRKRCAGRSTRRSMRLRLRPASCGRARSGSRGILFHEACGHGLEGDRAMRGRSAFADLLGEAVGPETLTLVDDPTLDGLSGSRRVDDEGWPSAPLVLIDAVGSRADARPGHRAPSADRPDRQRPARVVPRPAAARMTNTFVREGPHDPEEILRALPRGCTSPSSDAAMSTRRARFRLRRASRVSHRRRPQGCARGPCRIVGTACGRSRVSR